MSLRLRLLLVLLLIYCVGGWFLTHKALEQVRPRYLESMEETLVDVSVLLASVVEDEFSDDRLGTDGLGRVLASAQSREFEARIFSLRKSGMDLRVYVTNSEGRVLYDSTHQSVGHDFSQWNDVSRTLRGEYGARSTRDEPGDDSTQVIYVAAPIRHEGLIVGVLSVGKPTHGINELVAVAKRRLLLGAGAGGIAVLAGLLLVASWVITPLERLMIYARAVRDGCKSPRPILPGRTLRDLGAAFEEMRDALEGKQHAERYTQALAHEVKAPLAAIRGAAELLNEDMPPEQRRKFMENIRGESARIQQSIERLLELSSLEARKVLKQTERIEAGLILREAIDVMRPAMEGARVKLNVTRSDDAVVWGERILLREAVVNLLQNAVDFSPAGCGVVLSARLENARIAFTVEDCGPGVPDYALPRAFDRFYSLSRPASGKKSTGLGLALVREIAHLHSGEVVLENRPEGGARAVLWIPVEVNKPDR